VLAAVVMAAAAVVAGVVRPHVPCAARTHTHRSIN
jgi:hypothetical protein